MKKLYIGEEEKDALKTKEKNILFKEDSNELLKSKIHNNKRDSIIYQKRF